MVTAVTIDTLPAVQRFLEQHLETSIFLLSNLKDNGPHLGAHPTSGNYRCIEHDGGIVGVFCLTRRGEMLAQTAGRTDLVPRMLRACEREPSRVNAVLAEWAVADAIWRNISSEPGFRPDFALKSVVYRCEIPAPVAPVSSGIEMRQLAVADFDAWDPLNCAFQVEEGWPVTSTVEERRTWFQSGANRPWWGAFEGDRLVAIVCLNAAYGPAGQVGSLYTVPDRRRRGIARSLMRALMNSMRDRMELRETVLFASEENGAARAFYHSMGFETRGHFGLLFGSRAAG